MTNLRKTAKDAPHCFYCMATNYDGQQLCLAHSNELAHGRGSYHKTPDIFGAIVCQQCHDEIDGRKGRHHKEYKHEMQRIAHARTLKWWWDNGYIQVARRA